MKPGLFQILIIALVILVLFGRGRVSEMMGDFGKGVRSFKKGLADADDLTATARIDAAAEPRAEVRPATDKTAN